MTAFTIVAALMLAGAAAAVLVPLLRGRDVTGVDQDSTTVAVLRDQLRDLDGDLARGTIGEADHAQARAEIERRVLEEVGRSDGDAPIEGRRAAPWVPVTIAAMLPVLAVVFYLAVGTPGALHVRGDPAAARGNENVSPEQIEQMVEKLATRMAGEPDNVEGWTMLARAYLVMRRFDKAVDAYEHLVKREPGNADLLADYADALAAAAGGELAGKPMDAVNRALKADPAHPKALALAGTDAFNRGDYRTAITLWERMKASAPPGSELAQQIEAGIAEARSKAGMPASGTTPAKPGAAAARIAGRVTLDPKLAGRVEPGDTVFVFARSAEGGRVPLAVLRRSAKELPFDFSLDETMAMAPDRSLASVAGTVVVGARISKSGSATPQPGDLEGLSQPVKVGAEAVSVTIDTPRQ